MAYTIKGFAILAEDEDGTPMIIYSDDIEDAKLKITQENRFVQSDDSGRYGLDDTITYHLSVEGHHLNIRMDTTPLDNMLGAPPRQIEADTSQE